MYSASTSHTRMHGPQLASLAAAYTTYGYKQLLGSRLWGAMSSRSQQSLLSMGFLRRRSGDGRSVPSTSEARSLQTSTSVTVMPAATTTTVCGVSPSTPMSQESSGQSSEIVRSISVQSSTTVVVPSAPNQPVLQINRQAISCSPKQILGILLARFKVSGLNNLHGCTTVNSQIVHFAVIA